MGFLNDLTALKWTPWHRWHPQLAIRYLPVVEKIKEEGKGKKEKGEPFPKILEVGSGGLGIAPYLKQSITGVDLHFDPPIHPLLTPTIGDATKLKFPDSSFDIVVSLDMLEHLPENKRSQAIFEMIRVARGAVIIGVPCGQESEDQDQLLREEYRKRHGREFPFLKEQTEYGLPEEADIISSIESAARRYKKNVHIEQNGNERLDWRLFFMRRWMSNRMLANVIFRKLFLLFIPILRTFEKPPYYRQMFFCEIQEQ